MKRPGTAPGAALLVLCAAAATPAQADPLYAGQVVRVVPPSASVQVKRGERYSPLRRGDIVGDNDCVRVRTPNSRIEIQRDDGTTLPLAYSGEECRPVRAVRQQSRFTFRYVLSLFDYFTSRDARFQRSGGARAADMPILGLPLTGGVVVGPGERRLIVAWCQPQPAHVRLVDAEGRTLAEATPISPPYHGVTLPPARLLPGNRLTLVVRGGPSLEARFPVEVREPPAAPARSAAASLADRASETEGLRTADGRFDLEILQRVGQLYGEDDRGAILARAFCRT